MIKSSFLWESVDPNESTSLLSSAGMWNTWVTLVERSLGLVFQLPIGLLLVVMPVAGPPPNVGNCWS